MAELRDELVAASARDEAVVDDGYRGEVTHAVALETVGSGRSVVL